jgi:hypothetical protein
MPRKMADPFWQDLQLYKACMLSIYTAKGHPPKDAERLAEAAAKLQAASRERQQQAKTGRKKSDTGRADKPAAVL